MSNALRSDGGDARASVFAARVLIPRRELFERLAGAPRVTVATAPAGSGKTSLLRFWIAEARLAESVGWVSVEPEERDPQRFWISVLDALRGTTAGARAVRAVTPAPGVEGGAMVERLLEDLRSLTQPLWLVIDDLHELRSSVALRQLERLLARAPSELRFVLLTRGELRLGLHRLRLEGEVTEIRADELRFSLAEARALFEAVGIVLSDAAVELLHERTEGWAVGLRLAALSLEGHPDPERFAAEFSGSERTVAEYLMAEVLERQPDHVRALLLRTSILERVNGSLADLLTGGSDSERIFHELEEAGACVVSLDARRSWFRYHPLFADFLLLQLRRTAPGELGKLHIAAAHWYADHHCPVDAVRHAQAAEDWRLAARLLGDHWTRLWLSGARATAHALLAAFPVAAVTGDPQLAAMAAADQLFGGSLEECERYLALAARGAASVPADRRRRFEVLLTLLRLTVASQRGDLPAVVEDAEPLLDPETPDTAHLALGYEDRALALFSLGEAELSTFRLDDAEQHLEQALALTRASDLPFLEITALGELAHLAAMRSSLTLGLRRSMEAVALAERHGWTDEPVAGLAYMVLGGVTLVQGRLEEAEVWLARAERTLRIEGQPVAAALLKVERGMLELVGGRTENALVAFRGSERLARRVLAPQILITWARSFALQTLVRMGEAERGELIVAATDERERERAEMRIALAALRLAQDDAEAATRTLLPILDGSVAGDPTTVWLLHALVLEVSARDALGDAGAAERALERALDLAERDGLLFPFMLYPVRAVLERHRRCRTSHAWLVSELLSLLAGRPASRPAEPQPLRESLSESETRVLRYLPTNLSAPEIATELSVSVTTVKTHIQHIYGKLGAHRRAEAVERARSLGLLAPSSTRDRK